MKELTRAEEQVMQILWELDSAHVRELIPHFDDPKPAYNTVSTIIRILEKKGFVAHIAHGKSFEYYPLIKKDAYKKAYMKNFVNNYFGNSYQQMVSFFAKEKKLSASDIEDLLKEINKQA